MALTILFLIPNPATWWVVGITAAVALFGTGHGEAFRAALEQW